MRPLSPEHLTYLHSSFLFFSSNSVICSIKFVNGIIPFVDLIVWCIWEFAIISNPNCVMLMLESSIFVFLQSSISIGATCIPSCHIFFILFGSHSWIWGSHLCNHFVFGSFWIIIELFHSSFAHSFKSFSFCCGNWSVHLF